VVTELSEKFHINASFPFVFIDSWAKHPVNIDDPVQQEAFNRESAILWNFAVSKEEFVFKSIQDVLEENNELKNKVKYLEGVLEANITELLRIAEDHAKDLTDLRILSGHLNDQANIKATICCSLYQ
jgi:hypothetical protein